MKILDATCGAKNMWFQPNHPFVTFLDKRDGKYMNHLFDRTTNINPDVVGDWTKKLPFDDEYFDMVLFDPPHIIRDKVNKCNMDVLYGYLQKDTWRMDLQKGIQELFRVLKNEGVFVFKWGQSHVLIDEILRLFPYKPLFGNKNKDISKNDKDTIWLVFLKYRSEQTLNI